MNIQNTQRTNMKKICTKCKEEKSYSNFSKASKSKDGRKSRCKTCTSEDERKRRSTPKSKKHAAEYHVRTNSAERKQRVKDLAVLRMNDPEYKNKISEQNRIRNRKPEKQAAARKKYLKNMECPDFVKNRNKKNKAWGKTESGKIAKNNYKHKKRDTADGTIPRGISYPLTQDLQALLVGQNRCCNNCGCRMTQEDGQNNSQQLDHHIPLSKGGTHSIENVVWLCRDCNLFKSAKNPTLPLAIKISA